MTAIYFYDDAQARTFEPFALTRPVAELRAGALLVRERWTQVLGLEAGGSVSAAHLADFDEPDAAPVVSGGVPAGSVLVNARALPNLLDAQPDAARAIRIGGRVAAVRLPRDVSAEELRDGALALESLLDADAAVDDLRGHWLDEVWDLVGKLPTLLAEDVVDLARIRGIESTPARPDGCAVIGKSESKPHELFVEAGAEIEPFVTFDLSTGPIYVEKGAHVQSFTRLAGPLFIGRESLVGMDRISACSIGPVSRVHGEVSNTVFHGWCNKGHDGFVGHSYIGRWANLGANTVTSNLKNTYGKVELWTPSGIRPTSEQFLGTLFGDHAKTGIGLKLTTGTVLGAGAQVYGMQMPPKAVPPFAWGDEAPYAVFRLDKFLQVAERVMSRRHVELSERAKRQLSAAHAARWHVAPEEQP